MDIATRSYQMNRFLEHGVKYIEREIYRKLKEKSRYGMIVTLSGMRRVGKTVIMKKYLYEHKKEAFYYSFDEESFPDSKDLNEVIDYAISSGKKLIGLDEIQKVKDWGGTIKKYYDLYPEVKFVLTGSSSLYLRAGNESLAGRAIDLKVYPLSFREYTKFKNSINLDYYMKTGFPEIILKEIEPGDYIRTIINKIIEYDIPKLYDIKKPYIIEELLTLLAESIGKEIEYRNLGSELGTSKDTIKEYMGILENSYLIKTLYNYQPRKSSSIRKMKKVFFSFPSLADNFEMIQRGERLENVIFHHLRIYGEVFFWRYKNHEVDFIVKTKKNTLPIEVKSGSVGKSDLKGLKKFMERFKIKKGLVISRDRFDKIENDKGEIIIIPATEFLLNLEKWLV